MASPAPGEGRVTRTQYWKLVADGVIGPDDRVELLDGVIVSMSPQNPPHAFVIEKLTRRLSVAIDADASVRVQLPLDLSETFTPEPDLAVVAGRAEDRAVRHPTSALLVVEVADSTVFQDRVTKGTLYAAAGIPEYWVVNLRDGCVETYRHPDVGQRRYTESCILRRGDDLDVAALPHLSIPVAEILPP